MAIIDSVIVFVVSLLIGATGIYIAGRILTDTASFEKALVTALVGAIVWAITGFLFGWIPFLGLIVVLIAYIGVINWQYPGEWATATGIGLIALDHHPVRARGDRSRRVRRAGRSRGVAR